MGRWGEEIYQRQGISAMRGYGVRGKGGDRAESRTDETMTGLTDQASLLALGQMLTVVGVLYSGKEAETWIEAALGSLL